MISPAHLLSTLVDAVFPMTCASCRAIGNGLCDRCAPAAPLLERQLPTLRVFALGEYEAAFRRAVHALKDGRRDVAHALGERFAPHLEASRTLVAVPTTRSRRRVRGIDGVELIASVAAASSGCGQLSALRCIARTAQRGRTREERLIAKGRFICPTELVAAMDVTLIDDVCTTGATLEDCASVLRAAGANVTQAFVVAVANGRA